MVDKEDKKILGVTYSSESALNYLYTRYNSNGNLSNSSFSYLNKVLVSKNGKEMYSNCLEIFHNLKVIIAIELESRITRSTLDLIILKSVTVGVNRTFLNEQNRAIMLVSEDGKFADLLPKGDPGALIQSSSFTDVREEDLLSQFATGRLHESKNTGTLLNKVAKKI